MFIEFVNNRGPSGSQVSLPWGAEPASPLPSQAPAPVVGKHALCLEVQIMSRALWHICCVPPSVLGLPAFTAVPSHALGRGGCQIHSQHLICACFKFHKCSWSLTQLGADSRPPWRPAALASEPDGSGFGSFCTPYQAWKLGQISCPVWISVSSSVNDGDLTPVSERCCGNAVREGREVLGFHWTEGLGRVGNDGACPCPGGAHGRLPSPLHGVK